MTGNKTGLFLNREKGIPLYIQLKNQIKRRIRLGHWLPGHKLPTERELAEELEISRNTVSSAYRELELEGILTSYQGRGTFVTHQGGLWTREDKKARLLRIIDLAIEEATQLNFQLDEFLAIALSRAREKKEFLQMVRIAFVASSQEHCQYFMREIEPLAGISIKPVLLPQLKENQREVTKNFSDIDLVVTTFFYLNEVRELLSHLGKPIIGIALNLKPETIVALARIKRGQKMGLVCRSCTFASNFREFLTSAGIGNFQVEVTQATSKEELLVFLKKVDVLAVSSDRKEEVVELVQDKKPVIELKYCLDLGSINLIKSAVMGLKEK